MKKLIAYQTRDGKLFRSKKEARTYEQEQWEQRLERFMFQLKLDETLNPIKNRVKIMEFMVERRMLLKGIFQEAKPNKESK